MIKALLWKEWREQRWKLAFGTAMLLFFTGTLLSAGITSDREIAAMVSFGGGLLLAMYSAMGVFAPERTQNTLAFLGAKPAEAWKTFACKWIFGWLNFAVPLLACSLCFVFMYLGKKEWLLVPWGLILKGAIGGIAVSTIYYSLILCFAPRISSEALVGGIGLLVALIGVVHAILSTLGGNVYHQPDPPLLKELFCFINPLYWVEISFDRPYTSNTLLFIFVQLFVLCSTGLGSYRRWQRSF